MKEIEGTKRMYKNQIEQIRQRWQDTEDGYKKLSFKDAKADMECLLEEIDRRSEAEEDLNKTKAQMDEMKLRFENMQQEMIYDITKTIRKYDPH